MRRSSGFVVLVLPVVVAAVAGLVATGRPGSAQEADLADWAVPPGFSLAVDTEGYELPTAIAFVPDPGDGPGDPLYFVTELRGAVKVVTNDRTVHTFASVPTFEPGAEYPDLEGEAGMAGLCLDPARGDVYVTFAYKDRGGVLRNGMTMFRSEPVTFATRSTARVDYSDIFAPFVSANSHQIGGCAVVDDAVFVGIGDGGSPDASRDVDRLLGKVVCLTPDGAPCPDHPHEPEGGAGDAARYVWARGFRNPFGIRVVDGQVFVMDNGLDVDRFVQLERGADYRWDGTDPSIASTADVFFVPSFGPVHVAHVPPGSSALPEEYGGHFFVAASGSFRPPERGRPQPAGVFHFGYDRATRQATTVPRTILEHRGDPADQDVVGVATGPDGLYVVPILPGADGRSPVLRLEGGPGADHPYLIGEGEEGAEGLIATYGCRSCHQIEGRGGGIGPSLERDGLGRRLGNRLPSPAYEEQVAEVDRLQEEPFVSTRDARRAVLRAEGPDQWRTWVKHKLLEPKFDDPTAQMPDLDLEESEAELIASYLVDGEGGGGLFDRLRGREKALAAGFAAGVVASAGAAVALWLAWRWRRRRVAEARA